MNRLEKLKRAMQKGIMEDWFIRNIGVGDRDEDILKDGYTKSDLVYICVSTTARAISQVPLILGRVNPSTGEWEPIEGTTQSPWQTIIQRPNYLQDYQTWMQAIVSFLLLDGDVWVVPFPLIEQGPLSLWIVKEENMDPIRNDKTGQLEGWRYRPSGTQTYQIAMSEVAHIFFWNPNDPIMGIPPLEAGKISIVTDYKAAKFNQVFFDQGATIGGVLSTEQNLTSTQHKRLKDEIEAKYTGYEKSHKMLLLDGGLKFAQTSPSHKDMMFPEMRRLDKERILQIFGMKKAVISVTDDLNYATAKEQRKSWWQDTNLPIMRMITEALNFTFFDAEELEVRFDISGIEALHEDFRDKVDTAVKLTGIGFTPNEVNERLELGFDEAPWRDYFYMPQALKPVGLDAPILDDDDEEEEPPQLPPGQQPPQLPPPDEDDDEEEEEGGEFVIMPKLELKPDFEKRGKKLWKDMVRQAKPLEQKFKSKTKRMFFEWRKLVLDWLYSQQSKTVKDEAAPFMLTNPLTDIDEMGIQPLGKLKEAADAIYMDTLLAGLETIALEIGEVLDIDILSLPAAQEFLINKGVAISGLTDTQALRLRKTLTRGMERGESLEQLADRIRRSFSQAATRANTIARTEVFGALNCGRNTTIKETPFREVQWFTSLDERVRKSHKVMHSRRKKVNESWVVGGFKVRYPGDPKCKDPGQIINCRCIEVVALDSFRE